MARKAKLAAVAIAFLFLSTLAIVIVPGRVSLKLPAETLAGPGWGTSALLETGSLTAEYPEVAVDGAGNAIAIWIQSNGTDDRIWSNRYEVGVGWGNPEIVDAGGSSIYSDAPQIAMDGSGNAIAVWSQYYHSQNIFSRRYVVGSGWGTVEHVEENIYGSYSPRVAMNSEGAAVVVWEMGVEIWSNRYEVGTGWGSPERVHRPVSGSHGPYVGVAMDGEGNAFCVWSQYDGSNYENVSARRYDVVSGWGTTQLLETDDLLDRAWGVDVAADSLGNAVAIWDQYNNSDYEHRSIFTSRYAFGSGWEPAQLLGANDSSSESYPQVAMDDGGNATAIWSRYDGATSSNISASRYVAGSGWGAIELVSENVEWCECPQIAIDGAGNAVAVWCQWQNSRNDIWSNHYVMGSGWGTPVLVETEDSANFYDPRVGVDNLGNAIAVWHQSDGAVDHIWSNRYETSVIPEFQEVIMPLMGIATVFLVCFFDRRRRNP